MAEQLFLTQEEENYVRMGLLLTGISPRAVRVLFDREFAPTCLGTSLKKEYPKLRELLDHRVLNQAHWNLLFPKCGIPDSKAFDVTLIMTLLRNLCDLTIPHGGFDRLPMITEITPSSDLARIKYYRNVLAHLEDGKVDTTMFNAAWRDITGAVERLGGMQMKKECDRLLGKILDQTNYELMTNIRLSNSEIKELKVSFERLTQDMQRLKSYEEDKIPWHVREVHQEEVKRWQLDDSDFSGTTTSSKLYELTNQQDVTVVTVVGPKGCGKSFLAKHVALEMQQQHAYTIIPVHEIKEVIEYYDSNNKQLFVFDDVCPSLKILDQIVPSWNSRKKALEPKLNDNILKMIVCCSTEIYRDPRFKDISVLCEHTFDFEDEDNMLSDEDIKSIARQYLKEEDADALNEIRDLNKLSNFPMLCKEFADKKLENAPTFFSGCFPVNLPDSPINDITEVSINSSTSRTSNPQQVVQGLFMNSTFNNSQINITFNQKN